MSEKTTDDSVTSLQVSFEKDYLRQIKDVEEQQYIGTEVPLADDESSTGLKRELNLQGGGLKAKKI